VATRSTIAACVANRTRWQLIADSNADGDGTSTAICSPPVGNALSV